MRTRRLALCVMALATSTATPFLALTQATDSAAARGIRMHVPFGIGEELEYAVYFGIARGTGRLALLGVDTLRGQEAWHAEFRVRGGLLGFRVNDRYATWFTTSDLHSLRHIQETDHGPRESTRAFEIFPESQEYVENDGERRPSVALPLDEAAFMYFIRTVPLEVGATYEWERYFRPDRNPVRVHVLRRERINVPAGEFTTLVLRPVIKSRGLFGEGGDALVWLSDDSSRYVVRLRTRISIGTIDLLLKKVRPGAAQLAPR